MAVSHILGALGTGRLLLAPTMSLAPGAWWSGTRCSSSGHRRQRDVGKQHWRGSQDHVFQLCS